MKENKITDTPIKISVANPVENPKTINSLLV